MVGASQELYQMTSFPEALHGVSFKTAASFIYDTCHAVLLAVEETEGPQRHLLTVADLNQVKLQLPEHHCVGFRVAIYVYYVSCIPPDKDKSAPAQHVHCPTSAPGWFP